MEAEEVSARQGSRAEPGGALDWWQTFGAIAAVAIALVTTQTVRMRITVALAIGAAAVACVLLRQVAARPPWTIRRRVLFGIQVLAPAALVVAALLVSPAGAAPPTGGIGGEGGQQPHKSAGKDRVPTTERSGYLLTPSSFIDTNDQDKVDLDTSCPGWGDMHPRLGPSRCGELADLIVDEQGIHTRDGGPQFGWPAPGAPAGYDSCRDILTAEPAKGVNQVQVSDLAAGRQICVMTDKRDVALVRIEDVGVDGYDRLTSLTIGFTVWRSTG